MRDRNLDIETELLEAFKPLGGVRPPRTPSKERLLENSDYVFPDMEIVIELKSLEEDHIASERTIEKASAIYAAELRSGAAPVVAFGEVRMTTEGFSEEYKRKIADLYRVPIARLMRKANGQNLSTIQALGYSQPMGVFMLANNNETALDPGHLQWVLNQELLNGDYPGIDVAIAFSGALMAVAPGLKEPLDYWIKVSRHVGDKGRESSLERLRDAWYTYLSSRRGVRPQGFQADLQTLASLESACRPDLKR